MKKILIAGANSYVGNAVELWLKDAGHEVVVLDMVGDAWRETDFCVYDTVFHVAGIAHDTGKKKDAELYYKINRDLAIETAEKVKDSGVGQFVFMSSMLVYNGVRNRNITAETMPKVKGVYGDSKLQADNAIRQMNTEDFRVAIMRPPMIFGQDCKGNFPRLASLAVKAPFFPKIRNHRSMLHINNLCEIVKLIIDNDSQGIYFPQNPEYFSTTQTAVQIASLKGKKLRTTKLFNWLVRLMSIFMGSLRKLFGNLTYDQEISNHFNGQYQIINNQKSIEESIKTDTSSEEN